VQQFLADSDLGALSQQLFGLTTLAGFSQQVSRAFGFSGASAGSVSGAEQQQPETAFSIGEQEHAVPAHAPGDADRASLVMVATGNATAGVN
jgi:hypothetical protein